MLKQKEIICIVVNAVLVKMMLAFPKFILELCGNSAWITVLYNTLLVFLIFVFTFYRSKKNVIGIADELGGRVLRIITGIAVFMILLINVTPVFRDFSESVKIILLQDTRIEAITVVFLTVTAIGAYFGIDASAKIHSLFLPIAGGVLVMFFIMLIPSYNIVNIAPVFGKGADKIFVDGIRIMPLFGDIILLNVLMPYMKNYGAMKKSGIKVIIITGVGAALLIMTYCLIYGYPASEKFLLPIYQMSRIIHLSNFFSRFEVLFHFIMTIMMFLYSSLYVYAMSFVLQQSFLSASHKPYIAPVLIASLISMSVFPQPDSAKYIIAAITALIFTLGLPILYGSLHERRRKHENG